MAFQFWLTLASLVTLASICKGSEVPYLHFTFDNKDKMNESSPESRSRNIRATRIGSPVFTDEGKIGGGFLSNGGRGALSFEILDGVNAKKGFTVSFWCMAKNLTEWRSFFGMRVGEHNVRVETFSPGTLYTLYYDNGVNFKVERGSQSLVYKVDEWILLTIVFDGKIWYLYRDGKLGAKFIGFPPVSNSDKLTELIVGRGRDDETPNGVFKPAPPVAIDDVYLFDSVFSSNDVLKWAQERAGMRTVPSAVSSEVDIMSGVQTWNVANGMWSLSPNDKSWKNSRGQKTPFQNGAEVAFEDIGQNISVNISEVVNPSVLTFKNTKNGITFKSTAKNSYLMLPSNTRLSQAKTVFNVPVYLTGPVIMTGDLSFERMGENLSGTQPLSSIISPFTVPGGKTLSVKIPADSVGHTFRKLTNHGRVVVETGNLVLDPLSGSLPGGQYHLNGNNSILTLKPHSNGGHGGFTVTGSGTIVIEVESSDLRMSLNAQNFRGKVLLRKGVGAETKVKLLSDGMMLGQNAVFEIEDGLQLFHSDFSNCVIPRINLIGSGEINGERLGALRLSGRPFNSAILLLGDSVISPGVRLTGSVTHNLPKNPTLKIYGGNHSSTVYDMDFSSNIGTTAKPVNLILTTKDIILSGVGRFDTLTIDTGVTITANGLNSANSLIVGKGKALTITGGVEFKAGKVDNKGVINVMPNAALIAGCRYNGTVFMSPGSIIKVDNSQKPLIIDSLALPPSVTVNLHGNSQNWKSGDYPLVSWSKNAIQPSVSNFKPSDWLKNLELYIQNNTLYGKIPFALENPDDITFKNIDGSVAGAVSPEAKAYVVAKMKNRPQGKFSITAFAETIDGEISAAEAVTSAYLLGLIPEYSVSDNSITLSYAYNMNVSFDRHRATETTIPVKVQIEPFAGQGSLGRSINGYLQVCGRTSKDGPYIPIAEAKPGTVYVNDSITIDNVPKKSGRFPYVSFKVQFSATSMNAGKSNK